MALWSAVVTKLKEILGKMFGVKTIKDILHVTPLVSQKMEDAIVLWDKLYRDEAPWLHEPDKDNPVRVTSLGLPAMIASEKTRMALLELTSEITVPVTETEEANPNFRVGIRDNAETALGTENVSDGLNAISNTNLEQAQDINNPFENTPIIRTEEPVGNSERAEYLNKQYEKLKKVLRKQIEYGIAKGGLVIKPYIVVNDSVNEETGTDIEIEFEFVQADEFYPLAFDAAGRITEAAFLQTKVEDDAVYRRLEYHKWENNTVTVINKAYRAVDTAQFGINADTGLGKEVPLTDIPEWKDLQEKTTIEDISQPLFAYFRMPEANTVDPTSPLGVSGFSKAVKLIKDADMQYSRLLWEYEGGEMAVNIDRDAFKYMEDETGGHTKLPNLQERLYRLVDLTQEDLFQPYAPALRDESYNMGLNVILMRIEDVTGLSRGTLSDATQEAKTATELKILRQRSYQTNADIQQSIEQTLKDVIYIMNVFCDLYDITPDGEYNVSFEWDDSIIIDIDSELSKRITLQQNGLISKVENRMWYFGETESQAREALAKIHAENIRAMEDNMIIQNNLSRDVLGNNKPADNQQDVTEENMEEEI